MYICTYEYLWRFYLLFKAKNHFTLPAKKMRKISPQTMSRSWRFKAYLAEPLNVVALHNRGGVLETSWLRKQIIKVQIVLLVNIIYLFFL